MYGRKLLLDVGRHRRARECGGCGNRDRGRPTRWEVLLEHRRRVLPHLDDGADKEPHPLKALAVPRAVRQAVARAQCPGLPGMR